MKATRLWAQWQAILLSFALGFTRRGKLRFVEWRTGLALNVEEHTITQSLVALGRPQDWKTLEAFAEYGSWDLALVQHAVAGDIGRLPGCTWHGFHVCFVRRLLLAHGVIRLVKKGFRFSEDGVGNFYEVGDVVQGTRSRRSVANADVQVDRAALGHAFLMQ